MMDSLILLAHARLADANIFTVKNPVVTLFSVQKIYSVGTNVKSDPVNYGGNSSS